MLTSGERVSNTSERAQIVGITGESFANTAYDLRMKAGDLRTSRVWSGRWQIR